MSYLSFDYSHLHVSQFIVVFVDIYIDINNGYNNSINVRKSNVFDFGFDFEYNWNICQSIIRNHHAIGT